MENQIRLLDMTLGSSEHNNQMIQAYLSSSTAICAMIDQQISSSDVLNDIVDNAISSSSMVSGMITEMHEVHDSIIQKKTVDKKLDVSCIINEYLKTNGQFAELTSVNYAYHTDFIELSSHPYYKYRISTQHNSPTIYGIFDDQKNILSVGPVGVAQMSSMFTGVVSTDAVLENPQTSNAKYIVFASYTGGTLDMQVPTEVSSNSIQDAISLVSDIASSTAIGIAVESDFEPVSINIVAGKYIEKRLKTLATSSGYQITDPIPLTKGIVYKLLTKIGNNNVSRWALIDQNGDILFNDQQTASLTSFVENIIDCDAMLDTVPFATHFIASSTKADGNIVVTASQKTNVKINDVVEHIGEQISREWIVQNYALSDGYLDFNSKNISQSTIGKYTDFIEIDAKMKFKYSAQSYGNVCTFAVYSSSKTWLSAGGYDPNKNWMKTINAVIDCKDLLDALPNAKYIRFCSYGDAFLYPYVSLLSADILNNDVLDRKLEYVKSLNVLHGKTWLACGDSFTTPDLNEQTYDPELIEVKSYPYFISKRNEMNAVQPGRSGEAMSWNPHSPESNARSHFCQKVDGLSDQIAAADYITFMYGLNEQKQPKPLSTYSVNAGSDDSKLSVYLSSLISQNETFELSNYFIGSEIGHPAQVSDIMDYEVLSSYVFAGTLYGSKEDTSTSTVWGAWNYVLSAVYTHNPLIKAGIIITDGGIGQEQYDTQMDIATWWGIPVLDLDRSKNVPLMIGGKTGQEINPFIKNLKTEALAMSLTNHHPTVVGHEYRSTVIENFLRSL